MAVPRVLVVCLVAMMGSGALAEGVGVCDSGERSNSKSSPIALELNNAKTRCLANHGGEVYYTVDVPAHSDMQIVIRTRAIKEEVIAMKWARVKYKLGVYNAEKGSVDFSKQDSLKPGKDADAVSVSGSSHILTAPVVGNATWTSHSNTRTPLMLYVHNHGVGFHAPLRLDVGAFVVTGTCDVGLYEGSVFAAGYEPDTQRLCVDASFFPNAVITGAVEKGELVIRLQAHDDVDWDDIEVVVGKSDGDDDDDSFDDISAVPDSNNEYTFDAPGDYRFSVKLKEGAAVDAVRLTATFVIRRGDSGGGTPVPANGRAPPAPNCLPSPVDVCTVCNVGHYFADGECVDQCLGTGWSSVGEGALGSFCRTSVSDGFVDLSQSAHAAVSAALSADPYTFYLSYAVTLTGAGAGLFPERLLAHQVGNTMLAYDGVGVASRSGSGAAGLAASAVSFTVNAYARGGEDVEHARTLVEKYLGSRLKEDARVFMTAEPQVQAVFSGWVDSGGGDLRATTEVVSDDSGGKWYDVVWSWVQDNVYLFVGICVGVVVLVGVLVYCCCCRRRGAYGYGYAPAPGGLGYPPSMAY